MRGLVALGSDLGDRLGALRAGIAGMARRGIEVSALSSVWETEPVDVPGSTGFLNMAAAIEVPDAIEPEEVLFRLKEVEREIGGRRRGRNRSRVLDLDLLVLGGRIVETERLTLPHPRMWSRRFVLAPLAEIESDLRDPRTGRTVVETLALLPDRPWAKNAGPLAPRERAPVYSGRL